MTSFRDWARTTLEAGLLVWGGCGDGLQLIREGNRAGVVQYMYKGKDGHVVTPLRYVGAGLQAAVLASGGSFAAGNTGTSFLRADRTTVQFSPARFDHTRDCGCNTL